MRRSSAVVGHSCASVLRNRLRAGRLINQSACASHNPDSRATRNKYKMGSKCFFASVCLIACFLGAQGVDKYTDENRPYEFGFNIEGEQHRHEKKDEAGLIMGEFGFITADGVYHVTVYATDENGNFKILSMKNIRVKPYPTTSERQGHSLALPAPQPQQPTAPVAAPPAPVATTPKPSPVKSCSSCSIPTTPNPYVSRNDQQNYPNQQQTGQNYPQGGSAVAQGPQSGQNYPQQGGSPVYSQGDNESSVGQRNSKQYQPQRGPNQLQDPQIDTRINGQEGSRPSKPTLISAQMQIVDKNTDIYSRKPGENEGLPNGLSKNDMTKLLYTFNYTVGFHGHHEEGYINGAKKGYYFVTGRNGIRTRVDYEADENGFRPKISQEVLDVLSDEVPKPETEKDEKYGLKGYEFKWLYYPTNAK